MSRDCAIKLHPILTDLQAQLPAQLHTHRSMRRIFVQIKQNQK